MQYGEKNTFLLRAGRVLTVTVGDATTTGIVTQLPDSAGDEPGHPVPIAGVTLKFGPYGSTKKFDVSCYVGSLTVSDAATTPLDAESAQSIAGIKAFSAMPRFPASTVAAAGSTQADAPALSEGYNLVTGANAAKGVKLPVAVGGSLTQFVAVKNADAANAILKVYSGGDPDLINALAVDAAYSMAAKTTVIFFNYLGAWASFPLLAS